MNRRKALSIMGISDDITMEELKKRYRSLMMLTHPDVSEAHDYKYDASEINVAYEYLLKNEEKNKKIAKRRAEKKKKTQPKWDAPINPNAYASRDIFYRVEDADGEVIGDAVIDTGRYFWTRDEDFSLFLKSLYQCSKNIVKQSDEELGLNRSDDIKLLADITYLLSQQYVDSEMVLSFMCKAHRDDREIIYQVDAMLETELRWSNLKKGDTIYPSRLSMHRLYVMDKEKRELGYISFKDDRLYYGIIPLFERRAAQVKMSIKNPALKRLNRKKYIEVDMMIKRNAEDQEKMIESINLKIENLLKK